MNNKALAQALRSKGRNGDTDVVHVNEQEKDMLKAMGGSGTINPETGLREYGFFDEINNIGGAFGLDFRHPLRILNPYTAFMDTTHSPVSKVALPIAGAVVGGIYGGPFGAMGGAAAGSALSGADRKKIAISGVSALATAGLGSWLSGAGSAAGEAGGNAAGEAATSEAATQAGTDAAVKSAGDISAQQAADQAAQQGGSIAGDAIASNTSGEIANLAATEASQKTVGEQITDQLYKKLLARALKEGAGAAGESMKTPLMPIYQNPLTLAGSEAKVPKLTAQQIGNNPYAELVYGYNPNAR